MWSAAIRYLWISSSESELYWDISVFNLERQETTKKNSKKNQEKPRSLKSSLSILASCNLCKLSANAMKYKSEKFEQRWNEQKRNMRRRKEEEKR